MDLPSEPQLSVTPTGERAVVRLTVHGDVDFAGAPDLLVQFEKLLPAMPGSIEMDLAAVDFLDCAGVRALLQLQETATLSGHRVTLVAASPGVARILALLGYQHFLNAP